MKTMLLATALAATVGIGSAFASVTVYTDGTTFDNRPLASVASHGGMAMCDMPMQAASQLSSGGVKVVRFGPPDAGTTGTTG